MELFLKQNEDNSLLPIDAKVYRYFLYQHQLAGLINPFPLRTRDIRLYLSLTRKDLTNSKRRLKYKGLIDYHKSNKKGIIMYTIIGMEKQTDNNQRIPSVENSEKQTSTIGVPVAQTKEERELERFDAMLQEIVEGKHAIWEAQMQKKHGVDNVIEYLPSFRDHVIANSKIYTIYNINHLKQYFNVSFQFFIRRTPIEILIEYKEKSASVKYRRFCDWMIKQASNVSRNINPLTEAELDYLVEMYGKNKIFDTILTLNNRDDLVKKYYSLYRTLITWLSK